MQFIYGVVSSGPLNAEKLKDIGIDPMDHPYNHPNYYWMSPAQAETIRSWGNIQVEVLEHNKANFPNQDMFPHDPKNFGNWTNDNFGPIWIPKQGITVDIDMDNIALYERVINVYEDNDLEFRDGKILINGEEADSYTFKQDYYWAMGDNRHNSEDSRVWGFVPFDHIVGKPLFIWMSSENGIRWNRIFTSANKM